MSENFVEAARVIYRKAHAGQSDIGGHPYIYHPARVAASMVGCMGEKATAEMVAVAYLHDVVEDCHYSLDDLKRLFSQSRLSKPWTP